MKTIEQIKADLGVSVVSIRVLVILAEQAGHVVDALGCGVKTRRDGSQYVPYAQQYGARRPRSTGYRIVGSAREVAEYLFSESLEVESC
jgi:hypothetical protein